MQEIMKGNHKDPSAFLCGFGECNEVSPKPLAFSFQVPMPFTHIFTTLWQQLYQLLAQNSSMRQIFFIIFVSII